MVSFLFTYQGLLVFNTQCHNISIRLWIIFPLLSLLFFLKFSDRYDIRTLINEHDDPELCDMCQTVDDGNGPRPSIDDVIILRGTYCGTNVFFSLLAYSLK